MKAHFALYLTEIGLDTEAAKGKLDEVLRVAELLAREEVKDIFICDVIEANGARTHGELFCFTDNYILEVRDFRASLDVDIWPLRSGIGYLETKAKDYTWVSTPPESRLFVTAQGGDYASFDFRASGGNCARLKAIVEKYLLPRTR